jgi:hypothetical protein
MLLGPDSVLTPVGHRPVQILLESRSAPPSSMGISFLLLVDGPMTQLLRSMFTQWQALASPEVRFPKFPPLQGSLALWYALPLAQPHCSVLTVSLTPRIYIDTLLPYTLLINFYLYLAKYNTLYYHYFPKIVPPVRLRHR